MQNKKENINSNKQKATTKSKNSFTCKWSLCNVFLVRFRASGFWYTLNAGPSLMSSQTSCCCPESWRCCSHGSAVPSQTHESWDYDSAGHRCGRCWGVPAQSPERECLSGSWVDQSGLLGPPCSGEGRSQLTHTCREVTCVIAWTMNINQDPSCIRTMDLAMANSSSLGLVVTVAPNGSAGHRQPFFKDVASSETCLLSSVLATFSQMWVEKLWSLCV